MNEQEPEPEKQRCRAKKRGEYDRLRCCLPYGHAGECNFVVDDGPKRAPPSESAEIDRYRAENAALRELVREVYDNADVGWLGTSWDERAEKALGN